MLLNYLYKTSKDLNSDCTPIGNKALKNFKVEYTGNGDIVKYQSPSSGISVYEGDTIRLLLD